MEERSKLPADQVPISPNTMEVRLGILDDFLKFTSERYIFFGLKHQDMVATRSRIDTLRGRLRVS